MADKKDYLDELLFNLDDLGNLGEPLDFGTQGKATPKMGLEPPIHTQQEVTFDQDQFDAAQNMLQALEPEESGASQAIAQALAVDKPEGVEGEAVTSKDADKEMNKKQIFFQALANFLAVFTAKDPGGALMEVINMRMQQLSDDRQHEQEMAMQDTRHKQTLETNAQLNEMDIRGKQVSHELQMDREQTLAHQQAQYSIAGTVIDNRFKEAAIAAGFDDMVKLEQFRTGLQMEIARMQEGFLTGRLGVARNEDIKDAEVKFAIAGLTAPVRGALVRMLEGKASPEDYNMADRAIEQLSKMDNGKFVQGIQNFYLERLLQINTAEAMGTITPQESVYSKQALDASLKASGFGAVTSHEKDPRLNPNAQGLDKFGQQVVAVGAQMIINQHFTDFTDFVDAIEQSADVNWRGIPALQKDKVLKSLQVIFDRNREMLEQQLQGESRGVIGSNAPGNEPGFGLALPNLRR
jgi:hypothetical protein